MHSNELELRSVDRLLGESFFIPAYQRGYRWTSRQVTELLDDVFAFIQEKRNSKGEFYCLQPIVIADRENTWELIDGQQRLTTIFLILSYFNSRFTEENRKTLFSLEYETRPGSKVYLHSLDEPSKDLNIDYFHIWESYQAIRSWFKDKISQINIVESAFLNDVKVIWYEVRQDVNPIEVFARLNMGKIPLTNAELVKALFLRSSNFEADGKRALHLNQVKIAQEWDDMERRLQDNEFWYFLSNEPIESNRLEFVLNLRADELTDDVSLRRDKAYLFLAFNRHLKIDGVNITAEWEAVKRIFLLLDEWFRDRYLYHLIGFLVSQQGGAQGASIARIMKLSNDASSKTVFRKRLKDDVFLRMFYKQRGATGTGSDGTRETITQLLKGMDYNSGTNVIRNMLLLFNLVSLLENSKANVWFPFNFFKGEKWDIEHIRSVQSDMPERPDDQKRWLGNVIDYLAGAPTESKGAEGVAESGPPATIHAKLVAVRNAPLFDPDAFESLFNEIIERYDPDPDFEADNSIGNLTLLDAATNRSYKNAIFPIKRQTVIALDKVGKFVPLCTKNAFLKYYSPKIDKMLIWTKEDSAAHQAAMAETLTQFFLVDGAYP